MGLHGWVACGGANGCGFDGNCYLGDTGCATDLDCGGGYYCGWDGSCYRADAGCDGDFECPAGYYCWTDGNCYRETSSAGVPGDCGPGFFCDTTTGFSVADGDIAAGVPEPGDGVISLTGPTEVWAPLFDATPLGALHIVGSHISVHAPSDAQPTPELGLR